MLGFSVIKNNGTSEGSAAMTWIIRESYGGLSLKIQDEIEWMYMISYSRLQTFLEDRWYSIKYGKTEVIDMNVKTRIAQIIAKVLDQPSICDQLIKEDDLDKINMNSIQFIEIVVNIETEFNIEFDDNMLNYNAISSFNYLCNYVCELMEG